MHRYRHWWSGTVDFDWLSDYHRTRPVLRESHRVVGSYGVMLGLAGLGILFAPEAMVTGSLSRPVMFVCSILGLAMGIFSFRVHMTSRTMSATFVATADLGIGVSLLSLNPSQIALASTVTFVGMGNYASVFHGAKAYLLHSAWVSGVMAVIFVRALRAGGTSVLAMLVTLAITVFVVFVSGSLMRALLTNLERDAANAAFDPLTGLRNRRGLEFALQNLLTSSRHRHPSATVSAILIDIDGFKTINDKHGHDRGDDVLRTASDRIALCAQPPMIAGRIGGEEFLVIAVGDGALAALTAHRILASVHELEDPIPITVSVGVASLALDCMPDDVGSALAFISARADAAMYDAKRQGGHRVAFATASDGQGPD